jgi:hypothetical protein
MRKKEWGGGPTARQSCSAAFLASARSGPLQVISTHGTAVLRKAWLLQRQALSVAAQPPRLADAMHLPAQAGGECQDHGSLNVGLSSDVPGMLWRPKRVEAEAEAAARATVARAKRIIKVRRVNFHEGVQQSAFFV